MIGGNARATQQKNEIGQLMKFNALKNDAFPFSKSNHCLARNHCYSLLSVLTSLSCIFCSTRVRLRLVRFFVLDRLVALAAPTLCSAAASATYLIPRTPQQQCSNPSSSKILQLKTSSTPANSNDSNFKALLPQHFAK